MNTDTPFVEYLIIGSHTFSWLLLLIFAVFGIPLSALAHLDAGLIVVALPFIYLLGMLFDSVIQYALDPFRRRIRDDLFEYKKYKDEFIAYESSELYAAYEVRVRRVRVIGAAIFNWPLLSLSLLLNLGFTSVIQSFFVIVGGMVMCVLSIIAWRGLYYRAYKFRKNACDIIREKKAGILPTSKTTPPKAQK